jgi:carboxylate-amine ligase
VGIPPRYDDWQDYQKRIDFMTACKVIRDYTYLWWDVRPHPNFGTVELRVFDQQTRLEHTMGMAALSASLAHRLAAHYEDGRPSVEHPAELIDDNKVRAALTGIEGKLIDFDRGRDVPAVEMAKRCVDELREHAEELGCAGELDAVSDLIEHGTGARRQLDWLERHGDPQRMIAEIIRASAP